MTIHKEGKTYILVSFTLFVVVTLALIKFNPIDWITYCVSGLLLALFIIFLQFFRAPLRIATLNENHIISPADGKVVVIEKVFEPEFLKREVMQISVFMSPFNVHINWYPISGLVRYFKYHPGKYLVAWHPKSSTENERSSLVIERPDGTQILVRQIAGILARKICYYSNEGMIIQQGAQLGFIKFGSRVDVFLPLDANVQVELNQVVKGNKTILAHLK